MENRGKQFEKVIKDAFSKIEGCCIDRIPDQTNGFAGSSNICDFTVYKYPKLMYLECKSCHGNTWPLSNLTDKQFSGMREKIKYEGVLAGVMVWWVDKDATAYFPIEYIEYLKTVGAKSIRFDDTHGIQISGRKKRVFFDYDMKPFVQEAFYENH